ncbi:MAG: signal peptide protein [Phycisphaerales bacterium]|nr:signal peptide protein [Phycisphaerales bacterium]
MKRPNRRLVLPWFALSFAFLLGTGRVMAEDRKVPPEKTYSNTPYFHRIYLRDAEGNVIKAPPAKDDPGAKPFSLTTTCGKCHDYPAMSHGWHFNASEGNAPAGRPGEPWILSDVQTRTQIPLSYRKWPGTVHPYDIGMNDHAFVKTFGSHLPGGGAFANSNDLRFKMSGKLEVACLICHTSNGVYDQPERAKQVMESENFMWAPTVAALLGRVQGEAIKLKDNWDPADPDARPAPKVLYRADRFDPQDNVVFQVTRRVPNDRCYYCHTNVDAGKGDAGQTSLESRWNHDRDIHLIKGMLCSDCHRNGVDHMTVRGYEGEDKLRKDPTIASLSCKGCHMGAGTESAMGIDLGGRNAAPRPQHKGLPTLHFDKLTCTACHSGPWPGQATTMVQTSMAHRLGLPRHHREDDSAPNIQETVFLRNDMGKIAPHKVLYPSFWGRLNGTTVTPIQPADVLAAGTGASLGQKPNPQDDPPMTPLKKEAIIEVLNKLAAFKPPAPKAPVAAKPTTKPATTSATTAAAAPATTQPATPAWYSGEPVFVTGGKAFKRKADGKDLEEFDTPASDPYAWPLAHDVRGAQQALGARGCTDCHSSGAPIFDSTVSSTALLASAVTTTPMYEMRGEPMGALTAFAASYPLRPVLIATGYTCSVILSLVLIAYGGRAVSSVARRNVRKDV